jgi:hypothetical protein
MTDRVNTAVLMFAIALGAAAMSCSSSGDIRSDRPRQVLTWEPPEDFEPTHITEAGDGTRWGIFVSKRFSGKDNFWAVKSVDGGPWTNPIMLINAYYFSDLKVKVNEETIELEFYDIDDSYFYDYERFLDTEPDFPETVTVSLPFSFLYKDEDRDGMPDRIEQELMLSPRLPDSDADGKRDALDFCPLGKPVEHDEVLDIYSTALTKLMDLGNISGLVARHDTAWSSYYGTYYMYEPNVAYVALPGESSIPELPGLPIILIEVKSPLVFGGRQRYASFTGGTIPHLAFYKPQISILGNEATMDIEYVERRYRREKATMQFALHGNAWEVTQVVKDD